MFVINILKLLRKKESAQTEKKEIEIHFCITIYNLMISDQNMNCFFHFSSKRVMVVYSNSGRLRVLCINVVF